MKLFIITGSCGFIGSYIVSNLLANTNNLILGIDLKNYDNNNNIKYNHMQLDLSENENIPIIIKKIKEIKERYILFDDDICVYHLAAKTDQDDSSKAASDYYKHNVHTTINLLNIMDKTDIYKILYASSSNVYDDENINNEKMGVDHKIDPQTMLGNTKYISELIIKSYVDMYSFEAIIFRIFCVAGGISNHENNIISNFAENIAKNEKIIIYGKKYKTKDGTFIRDYIHINDVHKAFYFCSISDINLNWKVVNLGSGMGYSVLDIVERIKNIMIKFYPNQKIPQTVFMAKNIKYIDYKVSNNTNLINLVGWTPCKTLDDMIMDTMKGIN